MQALGGDTWSKGTTWETRRGWKDDIKMDFNGEAWIGFIWVGIGAGGGRLRIP